jgi:glycosyltransferase involved in cell wall biosynthesis
LLLGHPNGNQNVRNALGSLVEHEMLAEFWTSISWDPKSRWNHLLPAALRAQLERRSFTEAPARQVKTIPWKEIARLAANSTPLRQLLCSGGRPLSYIATSWYFDDRVARRLAKLNPDAVFAYEGAACKTFREARRLGISTLYELPSAHWYWEQKFLTEEAERNPAYANLLPKLSDSAAYMRLKDEELCSADCVFVPSRHVLRTLAGVVPEEKIRVIPYGAPESRPRTKVELDSKVPLRVLYVGSLIQRKGIGYLLEAIDILGSQITLTMVGRRFRPNAKVDAACRRHNWIETLPHAQVLGLMQQSDVLVLPSLSEGCALVVLEALACGLPVIVTPNTGSNELVRDGRDGFIVPICRADAIAERLDTLHRDRELLSEMSLNAQQAAAGRSWEVYRTELADAVRGLKWK